MKTQTKLYRQVDQDKNYIDKWIKTRRNILTQKQEYIDKWIKTRRRNILTQEQDYK